jgi:transcriptional regulator
MKKAVEILQGTLDMLILKAVSLGPLHGYAILKRLEQISGGALQIPQGSLYPALARLEHRGLLKSEWGESENNRKSKYYNLTVAGRRRLRQDTAYWGRLTDAVGDVLGTESLDDRPNEVCPEPRKPPCSPDSFER